MGRADARTSCVSSRRQDTGLGLVEVVIALSLLATMALGLLPLLVGSARLSAANRDLVAAASFSNARLAELKDAFPDSADTSCAALTARKAMNVADPAGTGLRASVDIASCPTVYPAAVVVSVNVWRAAGANPLVTLTTQIVVAKA